MRFTVVTEKRDDAVRGDFTVPYRLARKWRSLASAPDDAIEERVLQTGTVLGHQLFSDVEIKGNTIFLWIPPHRALHDPDSWSFHSDLADMMVVRCGCIEGTAAVAQDPAVLEGETRPIQYFRFNVENGRSRDRPEVSVPATPPPAAGRRRPSGRVAAAASGRGTRRARRRR